jgi:hypothetical protein
MRFREFKINNHQAIFEYDSSIPDEELKQIIIQRLKSEDDRSMLDKIYQALEKSTLDERIAGALAQDEDARSKLKVFAGLVMNTEGTYSEKQKFIENYSNGFIDTQKLTDTNKIHSFEEWITGDDFVKRVFDNLYGYTPQGIGPGEYALAVLSPEIKASGRSADLSGDLLINNVMCEVKARQQSGGRFFDGRKAKMNQRAVESAFNKLGIEVGKGISGKMWANAVRAKIPQDQLPVIAETIIKGAFSYLGDNETGKLKDLLIRGNSNEIKQEWGILSFENYKRMSKFETMLLLDGPKRHSLYFEDSRAVETILVAGQPYVVGPEQQVHPQMLFKI